MFFSKTILLQGVTGLGKALLCSLLTRSYSNVWSDSVLLFERRADDLPTKIKKIHETIEALERFGKREITAESKVINSVIALSGITFLTSTAQNKFDEETAASEPIPGRIGLATTPIHDPG